MIAASAAVATNSPDANQGADLFVGPDGSVQVDDTDAWSVTFDRSLHHYQNEGRRPSSPESCFRLRDGVSIEESSDGGATWLVVWSVEADAAQTLRSRKVTALDPEDIRPRDLVVTDAEVVASFDRIEPVVRRLEDGTWSPDPSEFRSLPGVALAIGAVAALLAATTLSASAAGRRVAPGRAMGTATAAIVSAWLCLVVLREIAADTGGGILVPPGNFRLPLLVPFVLLLLLPLVVACGLALMAPTRLWTSLDVVERVLLGAALLAVVTVPMIPLLRWQENGSGTYDGALLATVFITAADVLVSPAVVWWRSATTAEAGAGRPAAADQTAGK